MEPIIRKLWIHNLKGQAALCSLLCESIAKQFESGSLNVEQGRALADFLDQMQKERYVLQLVLELLERQEK